MCNFIGLRSFFTVVRTVKLTLHLRRATRNQSMKQPNRIIHLFLVSPVACRQKPRAIHPGFSNLRRRAAASRRPGNSKLSTNVRKKKVPGTRENCKTTSALASTFIMSALNVTSFGNRPTRRARLLEYSGTASALSRIPNPSLSHDAFAGILEIPGRRGSLSAWVARIASSRQIFYKLGHFAGPFRCATARSNGSTDGIIYKVFEERWR